MESKLIEVKKYKKKRKEVSAAGERDQMRSFPGEKRRREEEKNNDNRERMIIIERRDRRETEDD